MAHSKNHKPGLGNLFHLFPPYRRYSFLDDIDQYPFASKAKDLDLNNAWLLAELSTLVYDDQAFCRQQLKAKLGIKDHDIHWLKHKAVEGFVIDYQGCYIVIFQGTHFPRPSFTDVSSLTRTANNIIVDLSIKPIKEAMHIGAQDYSVLLHQGFVDALGPADENPAEPTLWHQLKNSLVKDQPLWLAGHSLGGAMATIAAMRLHRKVQGLYTFGAPCVGDVQAAAFINKTLDHKAFRYVNDGDIVSHIMEQPKFQRHFGSYRHGGQLQNIKVKGDIGLFALLTLAIDNLGLSLLDHCPVYYALGARYAL